MHYITDTKKFLIYQNIIILIPMILQILFSKNYILAEYLLVDNLFLLCIVPLIQRRGAILLSLVIFNSLKTSLLSPIQITLTPHINWSLLLMLFPWLIIGILFSYPRQLLISIVYFMVALITLFSNQQLQILELLFFSVLLAYNFIKMEHQNNISFYIAHLVLIIILIALSIFIGINFTGVKLDILITLESILCIIGILAWGQTPFIKSIILISFIYLLFNSCAIVKMMALN